MPRYLEAARGRPGLGKQKREACQQHLESPVPPKRARGKPHPCPLRFRLLCQMQGYYPRGSQYRRRGVWIREGSVDSHFVGRLFLP